MVMHLRSSLAERRHDENQPQEKEATARGASGAKTSRDDVSTTTTTTMTTTASTASSVISPSSPASFASPSSSLPLENQQQHPKRRRSMRNTNLLKLSDRSSLQYRRLEQLFFTGESSSSRTTKSKEDEHHLLQLGNVQLQKVHAAPHIYVIDNFLNAAELQYLDQVAATHRFERSYVDQIAGTEEDGNNSNDDDKGSHYDTTHRTSTFVSFQKQQDATIARIEAKAAELLGCWSTTSVEALQLVRYQEEQFFGVHHDMGDYNEETGQVALPPKSWYSKRRVVTLFCYLNAVEQGGATWFPVPNVRVQPVPGRAVLFSNVLSSGQPDARTIHAGERVTRGVKYGLNIWICED